VLERAPRSFDLARALPAAELLHELVALREARRAERVALAQETADGLTTHLPPYVV